MSDTLYATEDLYDSSSPGKRSQRPALPPGIGNTPLLGVPDLAGNLSPTVRVAAKCEMFNLGGSSKARPAHYMLAAARAGGRLRAGQTLLIPSSGNTALALASLAAALGLPTTIVMPENAGPERIGMARVLGAAVELTPATLGSDGAYQHALALYSAAPDTYSLIDQYRDPANWRAHFETTGPEIWRQTEGRITHFMAGLGTGGTLVGVARYLKTRNPAIRVIAAVPASAEERIPGLRYLGKGMTPPIYDASVVDEHFPVMARDAWRMAQRSAQYAGLAVGPSSGAALSVALSVAESLRQARIVVLYPDGIEKYLSALAE